MDREDFNSHCVFTGYGHEHDEHGIHNGAAGMPIHSHLSQKDPQKVIKEVKKAIEQGEGCQVFKIFGPLSTFQLLFLAYSLCCLLHF